MRRLGLLVSVVTLAATSGGCIFTSDLDRFTTDDSASTSLDCDNPRNVCLRLSDFGTRATQLVEADLVTDDFLRARAIFDPVEGDGDVEVILPRAILDADLDSDASFDVQVLADENDDGELKESDDATWTTALPSSGNVVITNSTTADAALDRPRELDGNFTMTFTGMTAHSGQLIEIWVQEDASGRTAGYYRLAQGPESGDFMISIPGVIGEVGARYRVQFYADFDENGAYQVRGGNPAGDHSWVRSAVATDSGITLDFAHTGEFEDLDIPAGYGF